MKFHLKLKMVDGTEHAVTTGVPDIVAWEMKNGRKVSDLADGIGYSDMCFMAWNALFRAKETPLKYDLWINNVDEIEFDSADPKSMPKEV